MDSKSCLNQNSLEHLDNSEDVDQMDSNFLLSKLNFRENNHIFDEANNSLKSNIRRWSINISKKHKLMGLSSYKKTIGFFPSKNHGILTQSNSEIVVDHLTNELEQYDQLMESNIKSAELRINTIKSMPASLSAKRQIFSRLNGSINRRSQLSSNSTFGCYPIVVYKKVLRFLGRFWATLEPFYESMKDIEGTFGGRVGVFFKFMRYLLMLNFFVAVCTFFFITFPQILYNAQISSDETTSNVTQFEFLDLITADGYLRQSVLFYGGYSNATLGTSYPYSLPYAYFMTMTVVYITVFTVISISMARSYRKSFIETSGNEQVLYSHKVFCAWDFGLSHIKAAEMKNNNVWKDLKELLRNETFKFEEEHQSKLRKFWNITSQITAHIFVVIMVAGLCVALWYLFERYEKDDHLPYKWKLLYISLVVNLAIVFCSILFSWISRMEEYKIPRTTIHINLLRNFFLEVAIVSVLLGFWITKYDSLNCWETSIGQEIYRILMLDFFIHTMGMCIYYFLRYLMNKYLPEYFSLPYFDITYSSLGLVFNQTLFWVGLLFSPVLAIIIVLKMLLIFYVMKFTVLKFCKAPQKLWRSNQTQTFFLVAIFITLLGVFVAHGYIITKIPVSKGCGPFREYGVMFKIFMEGILKLKQQDVFWKIVISLTKPATVGGILLTLCVLAYYLRAKANAQIAKVKLLKNMLYWEAKDKEFLMGKISRLTHENEAVYHVSDNEETVELRRYHRNDDYTETSDWKYENNLDKNLRLDFEHIPTTSGYTRFNETDDNLRNRLSRY